MEKAHQILGCKLRARFPAIYRKYADALRHLLSLYADSCDVAIVQLNHLICCGFLRST